MADLPILFSAPMVRAILRELEQPGSGKTQTRRVIKPQPIVTEHGSWRWEGRNGGFVGAMGTHVEEGFPESAKHWNHIQPGDRLYVREAWRVTKTLDNDAPRDLDHTTMPEWLASDPELFQGRKRRGMHLPRWASRITLIITDVRVQRLQEISSGDAAAEGVEHDSDGWRDYQMPGTQCCANARASFRTLWNSLNATRGYGWDANPWVAAYTFRPILGNIDRCVES